MILIGVALSAVWRARQHLLDFNRDAVPVDHHNTAGDRQVIGQDLDLVLLGGIKLNDGASAEPHDLVNGHGRGPQDHHEIDRYFIERRHEMQTHQPCGLLPSPDHHVRVSQWLMTVKPLI